MKLSLSQIKAITLGTAEIEESEAGLLFHRFTREQRELYEKRSADYYMKCGSASGVRFHFRTNSRKLSLQVDISRGSGRLYFAFEIFVNGARIDTLDNFSDVELPTSYCRVRLPQGEFLKEFDLGSGDKDVCVCFPWSAKVVLREVCLDDGAWLEPVKPKHRLLSFGDSITQGYDALYPSDKYVSQLADFLDAEEHNKGIGGETFFPDLAMTKESFVPDYITVAYGTNDWNKCTEEEFRSNCTAFFKNLCANYPNAKIFAISPLWRKDLNEYREFGEFTKIQQILQSITSQFETVSFIPGFAFVPQDENLYADLRLHPNDEGFAHYFKNLVKHFEKESVR